MKTKGSRRFLFICTSLVTLVGSAFAVSTAAAGEINCSGTYYIYPLAVHAKTSGSQVSGLITVTLYNGTSILKQGSVRASSSDLQAKKWLRFSGKSSDGGTGELAAYFDAASGNYNGKAIVRSTDGNIEVDVSCAYAEDVRRRKSTRRTF